MQIIHSTEFHIPEPAAVAIGKFDGLHAGHRKLLDALMQARDLGLATAVFTFDPSPMVFFGGGEACELSTREEKRRSFAALGIDYLIEFPLNAETAAIEPEEYIRRYLSEQMNARYIVAGGDLSFGAGGKGDFALLDRLSDRYSYLTHQVDKLRIDGVTVSSTVIREMVREGRMEEAARFLGGPYPILGQIVHGRQIGRSLGIPTINQLPESSKLLPPFGVYYSELRFEEPAADEDGDADAAADSRGKDTGAAVRPVYRGMTNIGVNPTIQAEQNPGGEPLVKVETYLYDFDGDVYGETAELRLLRFRRPERRFDSMETLKETMDADIAEGRRFHGI